LSFFPIRPSSSTNLILSQAPLDSLTLQLSQRIRRNPSSRTRITLAQFFRYSNRFPIELLVSLSNIPQRPVYRFLDEVPVVIALSFDDLQKLYKLFVRRLFVFVTQIRNQGKSRPLDEQLAPFAPVLRFLPCKLAACVQITAGRIHDIPGIEGPRPDFHFVGRGLLWLRDKRCQNFFFVNFASPQLVCQHMVFADFSREFVEHWSRYAICYGRMHSEICQFRAYLWIRKILELAEDLRARPAPSALASRPVGSPRTLFQNRGGL